MNEQNLGPESKRRQEAWAKSRELSEKAHSMQIDIDLMERTKVKPRPVVSPSPPKTKPAPKKEPTSGEKTRKGLTLTEIRKIYDDANMAIVNRIKSYRFTGVQGIQVR